MSNPIRSNEQSPLSLCASAKLAGLSMVVGESDWTRQVRLDIQSVAKHASTVLISGPNGTGKEILARAIHAQSPRHDRPFIPVDCAAFVSDLFPSHMFGHVKGAFTGANYESLGCIRAAHGGTLFLDEIGELEPALQAKLLRVLQERVVVPVGGLEGTPVDIRLICATNRDLRTEVVRGTFRQDLFYRLNVVQIRTTALKDRTTDVLILADHFLSTMARETGMPRMRLPHTAEVLLVAYPWPGNVRQLRNVLERAVVFSQGDEIDATLLARLLYEEQAPGVNFTETSLSIAGADRETSYHDAPTASDPETVWAQFQELDEASAGERPWVSLESIERFHILRTLQHTAFNQSEAARLLKITGRTLVGKIKRYGIDVSRSRRGRPANNPSARPPQ